MGEGYSLISDFPESCGQSELSEDFKFPHHRFPATFTEPVRAGQTGVPAFRRLRSERRWRWASRFI